MQVIVEDHDFAEQQLLRRWPRVAFAPNRHSAIGCATTGHEVRRIGRLRYELFIERDGKSYAGADHESRTFLEDIDRTSLNFQVVLNSRHVAAVRLTRALDGASDPHLSRALEHAGLDECDLPRTVINSRLAVLPETQARLQIPLLFRHMYRIGVLSGASYCVAAARPAVGSLFERFGFRRRPISYIDPIGGLMEVHVLDVFNKAVLAGGFEEALTCLEDEGAIPSQPTSEIAHV